MTILQYKAYQKRRLAMLQKNAKRGAVRGAEIYATRLRMYVPQKTRLLRNSIRRNNNTVRVGAKRDDNFAYVHWINQTPGTPYHVIRLRRDLSNGSFARLDSEDADVGPIFAAVYGSLPASWRWTGEVQFAQRALKETRDEWRVLVQKIKKKSLVAESI